MSTDAARRRYAVCGLSNRGIASFVRPLIGSVGARDAGLGFGGDEDDFSSVSELVAIVEPDTARAEAFLGTQLPAGHAEVPVFSPDEFDRMVETTRPDAVLVTSPDSTHADYVLAALAHDLDVISEKPLTSTAADAARILDAESRSRGTVRVAHNVRYTPRHRQIRRLIASGAIGRVTHMTLDYHVDTRHGASYFLRWNRRRDASGGLSVHKSCHHLDLMNWLVGDSPETVVAHGALNYYGPASPHRPPASDDGAPLSAAALRESDPYYLAQRDSATFPDHDEVRTGLYDLPYAAQYPAGSALYLYDDEIDIEDTYSALLRYRGGASLAYTIDFSSPWEGYTMGISGTHGRIEAAYGHERDGSPRRDSEHITLYPLFGEREQIAVVTGGGGHDGADAAMRRDLFGTPDAESVELALPATTEQAAIAVAAGEAMWRSATTGRIVDVAGLLAGRLP